MPDDDRKRRRLGDETKGRIADLSSGWSLDPEPPAAPEPVAAPSGRRKARTVPPPPPGSPERKKLEQVIVETKDQLEPAPSPDASGKIARPKPPTAPPPPPPRGRPTQPPPIPAAAKKATGPLTAMPAKGSTGPLAAMPGKPAAAKTSSGQTPRVIVDDSLPSEPGLPAKPGAPPVKLTVPVGEFDSGIQTMEDDKLRVSYQATIVRDAADALLGIPDKPMDVQLREVAAELRGDPTGLGTVPFERGDPTLGDARGDATTIEPPSLISRVPGGRLRTSAALRRKRGIVGDVYYVSTALLGVRRTRRELAVLEQRQQVRQISRKRHLVTLGRTAVVAETFDHPAVGKAREALSSVEDERSHHAGAVAAADAELDRVRRDRDVSGKHHISAGSALDAELAELAKKLEPLEKEVAIARKRASEVQDSIKRIDRKLAETESLLVSVKGEKMDRAAIMAELATLKADRRAVQKDEPAIAAELDALNPRIAAIEAARGDAQKKKRELEQAETDDKKRTAELLDAIGAKRKVVDRAAAEAEAARDRVLFELGERLYVDRPRMLAAQLSPIDQIDLEYGESERRIMELREILSNVDRAKLARGAAVVFLALAAFGAFLGWLIYMLV